MSRNRGREFKPVKGDPAHRKIDTRRSSNVEAVSYSPETGQLSVTYRGGRRYDYSGVPAETADGLRKASSKGEYLHRHIIDKFEAVKSGLDEAD